ncbi:MAG: neutral/alkaline non-lysosomal ceramidase N-terminal domain-containing protein [Planctomycetes bacterium]|nr:neutral/alkaline non-lysosomal ceramidase N-terminal domain-containing protein [Planctomycetota bacterium]
MERGVSRRRFLVLAAAAAAGCAPRGRSAESPPAWKAGLAKVRITPDKSVWMTGFASRTKPSEGTLHDLYARALALEDASGGRAVLVTADLLGSPAVVAKRVADEAQRRYGLARDRLILAFSHTHGGPSVADLLRVLANPRMTPEQQRDVEDYTRGLVDKVVVLVGEALGNLRPARLSVGQGEVPFATNRRKKTEKGYVIGVNPDGPVDHSVPVLRVDGEDGRLRAAVFLYACHNTTLGGDIYQFHGDYAGFAESVLEARHPGATAMFMAGCGGDCNPYPRGTVDLARQYGQTLAEAVDGVLGGALQPVQGGLRTAFGTAALPFAPPPAREALEAQTTDKNQFVQWHAKEMLAILDRDGRLPATYPAPVQAWRLGDQVTLVALGGEVVVDYALRLKRELGPDGLWVAGYCNDVFAYVPSRRVLEEGGYEAGGAMIYYGHPGPFAEEVEEVLIRRVRELVGQVRGR